MTSETSDFPGVRFFSRSPFRSGFFLAEIVFSSAIVVACVGMFFVYSNRLSTGMEYLLFLSCLSSVFSLAAAWSSHSNVQEAYFLGAAAELSNESPVHPALNTAAKAIQGGLYRVNFLAGFITFMVALSLRRSTGHF
jgi:hypothetical protein